VLIAAGLFTLFFWLILQRSVWPNIKAKYLEQPPRLATLFGDKTPIDAPPADDPDQREV